MNKRNGGVKFELKAKRFPCLNKCVYLRVLGNKFDMYFENIRDLFA